MLTKHKFLACFLSIILLNGCITRYKPLTRDVPKPPHIRPVLVKDDCVCGEDLNNMIDNWLDYLGYIEVLKSLGCYKEAK